MNQLNTEEETDLKAREILLNYYSSECTIHGAYILTVAIGVFAFLQVTKLMRESIEINVINSLVFSAFVIVGVYLLTKMLFWGIIASAVTHVREFTVEEVEKKFDKKSFKITFLFRLHKACISFFENNHQHLNYFAGVGRKDSHTVFLYLFFLILIALIFYFILIPILL